MKNYDQTVWLAVAGAVGAAASPFITGLFNRRSVDINISSDLLKISQGVAKQLEQRLDDVNKRLLALESENVTLRRKLADAEAKIERHERENRALRARLGKYEKVNGI